MNRPPRSPKEPLIGRYYMFRIFFVAVIVTALTIGFFFIYDNLGYEIEYARTLAVNMLVLCEMVYLFNCRKLNETIFSKEFLKNKIAFIVTGVLIVIQMGFTYLPFMQSLFGIASLRFIDWLYLLAGGAVLLLLVEAEKAISGLVRKKMKK